MSLHSRTSRVMLCGTDIRILSPMCHAGTTPRLGSVLDMLDDSAPLTNVSLASHDQHETVAASAVTVPTRNASQSGASTTCWCWPQWMRSLAVSLQLFLRR